MRPPLATARPWERRCVVSQRSVASTRPTVVGCYAFFDKVFPALGLLDYTEGMYHGDARVPYEVAQQNQIAYVLDQVNCGAGTRLIDVGCGNGELLAAAARRGAGAVGITISPEQVDRCRSRGLDARRVDYRDLDDAWFEQFDAVVANGPIEHFALPEDAAAGRDDAVYRRMFEIFHRLIDPHSPVRKLINTTIHFVRPPNPRDLLSNPRRFQWGSERFHWAMLERSFGGWYPQLGQFDRCAEGLFQLRTSVDGTEDYHWTSEQWLRRVQSELGHLGAAARMLGRTLGVFFRQPRLCATMLTCMLASQSWNWQFRGKHPPTCLLRQTWDWQPRA